MTLRLTKQEKRWGWAYLLLQMLVIPLVVALVCVWMGVLSETIINAACFFLNAALAVAVFRRLLTQSFRNCAGNWMETVVTAIKGFGLYWLLNLAVTMVILHIQPDFGNVNDATVGAMIDEFPAMMTIAVIFAAPLAEECLFRGWMFTGLAERSVPLAYIVTCGFFSAAHVVSYIGFYEPLTLVLCFAQYLGPSIALCWTCRKDDSLCAPLLLHMAVNTLGCILLR